MAASKRQGNGSGGTCNRQTNGSPETVDSEVEVSMLNPQVERTIYMKKSRILFNLFERMASVAVHAEVGSPIWKKMTRAVDVAYRALLGKEDVPMARMLLLDCVDYAVGLSRRLKRQEELERLAQGEGRAARIAELELILERRTANRFEAETNKAALRHPIDLIVFDFSTRRPDLADAISTPEAREALAHLAISWDAGAGKPKGGTTRRSKWEDADELMKVVGLVGSGVESLKKEWQEYSKKRLRK